MGTEALIGGLFGLASAGVSAVGTARASSANAAAQNQLNKETMDFNRVEAEKARDWQAQQSVIDRQFNAEQNVIAREFAERMSSTAHQREISDLKAAGLNPIMAVNSGAAVNSVSPIGHSSSGGSAASVSGLKAPEFQNVLGSFVGSALEGMRLSNDYKRAQIADKEADAALKNADTARYAQEWRHWIENEKMNISKAEANARIDKLNSEIKIAWEDLDIRKDLRDATVDERQAMVAKLLSDVEVSKGQAALLGLQQEELTRKMRYGSVLMTYLPADIRDKVASHMIDFVAENGDVLSQFLQKSGGDIFDYKDGHEFFHQVVLPKVSDWLKKKGW